MKRSKLVAVALVAAATLYLLLPISSPGAVGLLRQLPMLAHYPPDYDRGDGLFSASHIAVVRVPTEAFHPEAFRTQLANAGWSEGKDGKWCKPQGGFPPAYATLRIQNQGDTVRVTLTSTVSKF